VEPLFGLVIATAVSMAIIPVMWRFAPALGLIDRPDPRKVHKAPIPSVGGIGIVIGALVPLFLVLPRNALAEAYTLGALVLFAFGVWDDRRTLSHRVKFIGQLIAAALVIFHGDLWIEHAPFLGIDSLPKWAGVTLTFVAIVGMINAMNTSDGLDGLAGGESLLSLLVIAFLAYMVDGTETLIFAITTIGGVLGFLRFNTYPARVFMGDAGSQFLGFSLAFLAIHLTQRTFTSLSPATTLLFLGLPIVDIFSVMIMRASRGESPFRAARNHIHHRLLDLGFTHYETVIRIYALQALFVLSAVVLRHESDWTIAAFYFGGVAILFTLLVRAERSGWRRKEEETSEIWWWEKLVQSAPVARYPYFLIAIGVPLYLAGAAFVTTAVPRDFGVTSAVLAVVLLAEMLHRREQVPFLMRGAVYVAVVFVAYLTTTEGSLAEATGTEVAFFGILTVAIALTVRYNTGVRFQTTPMDYLILAGVAIVALFGQRGFEVTGVSLLMVKAVLMLYATEVIFERTQSRWNLLNLAALFALAVFAWRGLALG
jgi:UDP-GlcNAc:undecaprenyl-phosphate GlcNAc-1-phosphate transferase